MKSRFAARPCIATIALLLLLVGAASADATTLHPVGSFDQPTFITSDPEDPNRLLVVERLGTIKLLEDNSETTFADLTGLVGCAPNDCLGERGLMSIALAPDFSTSGHLYAFYGQEGSGELHVDELTASGDTAPVSTRRPVLAIPHPGSDDHYGGQLQFGPDGYLYISTGDGGGPNDVFHHAQDLGSPYGKILRIDAEQSGEAPYTVPAGNPFPGAPPPADTIWSLGLRNPFRFSFDRLTGDMVIADVGQAAREEVNLAPSPAPGVVGGAGANYGWNCREGLVEGPADDLPGDGCETTPFVDPVFDYPHFDPGGGVAHGCAIIGGYVARDPRLGDLYGRYVYGDLCIGEIRSMSLAGVASGSACGDRWEGLNVNGARSFGEDSGGRLYVIGNDGSIWRFKGKTEEHCPSADEAATGDPRGPVVSTSSIETTVRVKVAGRRVKAGGRAALTAQVLPCERRGAQRLQLNMGGRPLMSRPLDAACKVVFRPVVARRSSFRVLVPAIGAYTAGRSQRLKIEIFRPQYRV